MKKSRLSLFKSTSMLISVLGVLMIVSSMIVAAYIGFNVISSEISSEISSGSQYEILNSLKANYTELKAKFNSTKPTIFTGSNKTKEKQYIDAELELLRADSAISDVESVLNSGKPSSDVDARIKTAKEKLSIASKAYNEL
ncbi:hypothetical protein ALNOE001_12040 [Candidatus Methanobinarius endosymbioticus]|uniref:Chemotaxis methyl-accepting receptor HlyB-like 4HB MCP domain-containing protein n=1 Tax=Candidatus Methanobinarius endosymbioticus TaxID=2006182 RepID=A0A366MC81_9EURY|nr:hypothetical protein ALNOE001_12040 [Candidatus Methanobinarius endosymbioticus]